jgi:hypothetical protein
MGAAMNLPPAIQLNNSMDSAERENLDHVIGIAILWNSPMNAFGALTMLRCVCLNLKKDGLEVTSHGSLFGQGLTGIGMSEIKCVGGFVVVIAYVDDRKAGIKSLCEFGESMGLNYEVAWADADEDVWRVVHSAIPKMLLPFERFLSAEVVAEQKVAMEAEDKAVNKYVEAVQNFTIGPNGNAESRRRMERRAGRDGNI